MRITISINGVLRDTLRRFKEIYEKYEGKEIEEEIVSLDLLPYVDFDSESELLKFMYEEAPMEIFGQAKETIPNVMSHLTTLYLEGPKDQYVRLVSDELSKGKAATFWFLAKYGCIVDEILFYKMENVMDIWEKTDIFITTEPYILETKPEGKICILVEKPYNEDLNADKTIKSINELTNFKN